MNQHAIIQEADETRDLTGFSSHNERKGFIMRSKKSIKERLLEKVCIDTDTNCWLWTGGTNGKGYGRIWDTTHRQTHRLSYELHVGPIPKGMCVCHKCDVRNCINPEHLFLGTNRDNVDDKVAKGRQGRLKGSSNPYSKLTEKEVAAIREIFRRFPPAINQNSEWSGLRQFVADWFGVGLGIVKDIKNGRAWKHVQ